MRREGSKRISRAFENKKDAMEYAGIIALNDGGSIVAHRHNGQFKSFKHGTELQVPKHKIAPIITGTLEIRTPIANNAEPIVETITLV